MVFSRPEVLDFKSLIATNLPKTFPISSTEISFNNPSQFTGTIYIVSNISSMRCSVSSPDETLRRELKIIYYDAQRSIFDKL